jgi:hypothetical protein
LQQSSFRSGRQALRANCQSLRARQIARKRFAIITCHGALAWLDIGDDRYLGIWAIVSKLLSDEIKSPAQAQVLSTIGIVPYGAAF